MDIQDEWALSLSFFLAALSTLGIRRRAHRRRLLLTRLVI
jgi:hypothetical protein